MIAKYKRQSNYAAGLWFLCTAILIASMQSSPGNIWDNGDAPRIVLMISSIISYWFAFWAYAKAKGRSGILGLVLPLFSIVGLVILAGLEDLHPEEPRGS
jgi:hypothetical protein